MRKKARKKRLLKVTLRRSPIGYSWRHKETLRALGLTKLHRSKVFEDSPSLRGMLHLVSRLVEVEEVKASKEGE